jgi:hypothetical protein
VLNVAGPFHVYVDGVTEIDFESLDDCGIGAAWTYELHRTTVAESNRSVEEVPH